MSLTRAASSAPTLNATTRELSAPATKPRTKPEPTLPPHVETFLGMLKTHFESARDSRPWDQHDTRAYGKVVLKLSGDECRILMDRLRTRYHWRPSVAQVSEALAELLEKSAPERVLSGADAAMRTVHRAPRALPSAANGLHREIARREHARRRASLGHSPTRKPENQAPASVPVSWVGLLVTVLMDGRSGNESRGIVFAENEDQVRIKFGDFDFQWVDKSLVRMEVPR